MKKKLTLIVAAVLTAASLSVPRADATWCWNEHAACGGENMCCVILEVLSRVGLQQVVGR